MNEVGIISEICGNKARVAINSMITDFLPVVQIGNEFVRVWTPIRVGEQVSVIPIRGDLNSGIVLRSLYQEAFKPSDTNTKKATMEFEDGSLISYDTASSTLEVLSQKVININVSKNVNITCENATINASKAINATTQTTTITSPTVLIKGNVRIDGNLSTTGNINDSRGDLTGHSHNDSDGATSLPR